MNTLSQRGALQAGKWGLYAVGLTLLATGCAPRIPRPELQRSIRKWILSQPEDLRARLRGEQPPRGSSLRLAAFAISEALRRSQEVIPEALESIDLRRLDAIARQVETKSRDARESLETCAEEFTRAEEALRDPEERSQVQALEEQGLDSFSKVRESDLAEFLRLLEDLIDRVRECTPNEATPDLVRVAVEKLAAVREETRNAVRNLEALAWHPSGHSRLAARVEKLEDAARNLDALARTLRDEGNSEGAARAEELAKESRKAADNILKGVAAGPAASDDDVISLEDFTKDFRRQINERLTQRAKTVTEENRYLTRTQAAIVFVPTLEVAEPALVQSFSMRNFIQAFWPSYDPTDVRHHVEKEIVATPTVKLWEGSESRAYHLSRLDSALRTDLVESVTQDRLNENWFWTRGDYVSLDFGLTGIPLGGESSTYDRRVDDAFPQFLFGAGLNFWQLQASGGMLLYRENSAAGGDFKMEYYIGISIELFNKGLGKASTESSTEAEASQG